VEKARQEKLKDGKIVSGKKPLEPKTPSRTDLTESQLETAKMLGLDKNPKKLQIFKSQILKIGNA
jgi:hypothetical protein